MNSEVSVSNYANNSNLIYGAHYVTLDSDKVTYENNTGKFILEYATPDMSGGSFNRVLPKGNTGNIINRNKPRISKITSSNYLTLKVPKHLFYITRVDIVGKTSVKIIRKEFLKGQKFIVVNIDGDVEKPCIIGVME